MDNARFQKILDDVRTSKGFLELAAARIEKCMAEGAVGSIARARKNMANAYSSLLEASDVICTVVKDVRPLVAEENVDDAK